MSLCYRVFRQIFGALPALLLLSSALAAQAAPLIFAVHPYLSTSELEKRFTPLVKHLSADIGLPISLRVSADYESHIQAIGDGRADLAYIGPGELLIAEARYGRRILLGQVEINGHRGLSGHLVTRQPTGTARASANADPASEANGTINANPNNDAIGKVVLNTLRGKRIAFVDQQSTMGYLVPMAVLKRAGVQERDFQSSKFVGTHENVALGVLAGEFQVGAVKDETFEKYRDRGLYSIYPLPTVPEHVFIASPRIPAEWQIRIRRALLKMADDEAGRTALQAIRPDLSKVSPIDEQAFLALRKLLGIPASANKPAGHTP